MGTHVIVGAGPVGSGTAQRLAAMGHDVKVVTRSGSGPSGTGIECLAADATDSDALAKLAAGADTLYNCANPPYDQWATTWPPLAESFLSAAEASGARLVTMGNLYVYPAGSSPMSATTPLDPPSKKGAIRATMWREALAANDAGRIQAAEVRASDFFGPGVGANGHLGDRVVPKALKGKNVSFIGDPHQPHSWSYMGDVAATMATVGTDERAMGRPWHVPTLPPMTAQQMVDAITNAADVDPVTVRSIPPLVLRLAGLFVPAMRELREMLYQFDEPFVIEASETEATFGLTATPLADQIEATIASYR